MTFDRSTLWILPEYQRKSPGSLILNARCEQCFRRCSISSKLHGAFPSAYVDRLADVFSSLCVMLDEVNPTEQDTGQPNHSSDASEV